jgi:hypothetical protein
MRLETKIAKNEEIEVDRKTASLQIRAMYLGEKILNCTKNINFKF